MRFFSARTVLCCGLVLGCAGGLLLGRDLYMAAKAQFAAQMIARAWRAHLADGADHRPWPWADMHPIAWLEAPRLDVSLPVLSDATGPSLAFGLGHIRGGARPGESGACALAGHRDSWARFVARLEAGDEIRLTTREGVRVYRVERLAIVDRRDMLLLEAGAGERLIVVTCYPFDALLRGPWRYIVVCAPAVA